MATPISNGLSPVNTTIAPAAASLGGSPLPAVITLSKTELWIQAIFFYFFLSGIASGVPCWLITVVIWRTKQLRSRFFIIVGFLMFARGLLCVTGLTSGAYRILRTAGVCGTDFKRITCILIHFNLYYGWTIEMSILCTLVIDRMLAIIAVGWYRRFTRRSAVYVCLGQYAVIAAIKIIPVLATDPLLETASCVNMYAPINPTFAQFSQYIDFAIALLIILLYATLIVYIRTRVRTQMMSQKNTSLNATLERQLKLIPVLRNLVLIHFALMFPGKLLNLLASVVPVEYQQRMVAYGGMILNVDVFVNAVLLLITHADIRNAAFPCLAGKKSGDNRVSSTMMTPAGRRDGSVQIEKNAEMISNGRSRGMSVSQQQ